MRQGRTLSEFAAEIERQANCKHDYISDTRSLTMYNDLSLTLGAHRPDLAFNVQDTAHKQIAARIGIPAKYYNRMCDSAPALLAANVNHWFHEEPERRMVRTIDGRARAFLSDRYARIDNVDVAASIMPVLAEEASKGQLTIISQEITDRKLYIKAVNPRVEQEVTVGDVVQAGVQITNSEIGLGALAVTPLIYRLICRNGMIVNDNRYRKYHIGAKATEGQDVYEMLSDETLRADDNAVLLKARDVVRGALDEARFSRTVDNLRDATGRKIEGNPVKAIEVLGKTLGITQDEQTDVLRHLIEGGDLSAWGLANAVTRTANDRYSYDRASDFEAFGGRVIDLAPAAWHEIAIAA